MTAHDSQQDPGLPPRQSPLPAFFYGGGRTVPVETPDPHFGEEVTTPMRFDRRTMLGLVAGTGMLASVLFAGGVLIGASMFMGDPVAGPVTGTLDVTDEGEGTEIETLIGASSPRAKPDVATSMPNSAESAPETVLAEVSETSEPVAAVSPPAVQVAALPDEPVAEESPSPTSIEQVIAETLKQEEVQPGPTEAQTQHTAESVTEIASVEPTAPIIPETPVKATQIVQPADKPVVPTPKSEPVRASGEIPPPPPVPLVKTSPFSVQVGAFKVRANANKIVAQLKAKGLDPLVIRRGNTGEKVWFFVRVGNYGDREQARQAAARLQKQNSVKGFTVRAEPGEVILE